MSSSVTPSTVQRAMDGDPSILAQQANSVDGLPQLSSEASSNVPSLVSSSSSTPQIDAVDLRGLQRNDSVQQTEIKDEHKPPLQLGMMGIEGYGTSDIVTWGGGWPDSHAQNPSTTEQTDEPTVASCCMPASIPEEPAASPRPSSCCAPKPADPFNAPELHRPSLPQGRAQIPSGMQSNGAFNGLNTNFGVDLTDPFSPTGARYGEMQPAQNYDFFAQFESRHGCGTNGQLSSHINSGVEQHECECGDGCLCLGCSQHPANKTTTDYVRFHNELALRGYNMPQLRVPFVGFPPLPYSQAPSQYGQQMHPGSISALQQNQFIPGFQATYNPLQGYGLPQGIPPQMASQMQMQTSTNELQQFHLHSPLGPSTSATNSDFHFQNGFPRSRGPAYQDRPDSQRPLSSLDSVALPTGFDSEAGMNHDSPSTDQDDTASTLSPSSFYVQQYNVPGCSDVTGTCHCGDGCTCVGCLVHSGHENDIANETSADTTRRLTEALENNSALTGTRDLHEFSLDSFHGGTHDTLFPTSVPG